MSESEAGVAVIRAKLKLPDAEAFVRAFAPRINASGMLVRTKQIKPIGAKIRFEFSLESGERMLLGEGVVRKVKGGDQPGMTIRFTRLNQASKELIDRIVAWKEEQAALEGAPRALRDPDEELPIPAPEGYGLSMDAGEPPEEPEDEPGDDQGAPLARSAPHEGVVPASQDEVAPLHHSSAAVPFHSGHYGAHGGGQLLQPGNVLSALESVEEDAPASGAAAAGPAAFSLDLDEAELDDVLGNLFGGADEGVGALFATSEAEPSAPSFLAPIPQEDSAHAAESEDMGLRFADPSLAGAGSLDPSVDPAPLAPPPARRADAFAAMMAAAEDEEEEAEAPAHSDAFGALLRGEEELPEEPEEDSDAFAAVMSRSAAPGAAPSAAPPGEEDDDAFAAMMEAAQREAEEDAPIPLLMSADEGDEGDGDGDDEPVMDLGAAEEEGDAGAQEDAFGALLTRGYHEEEEPRADAFAAMMAGGDMAPAPEEEDDDAFEAMISHSAAQEHAPEGADEGDEGDAFAAMMRAAAQREAGAFGEEPEEEEVAALSNTGEQRRLARLALSRVPTGEIPALRPRAGDAQEEDADSLADAIVAASQDQSVDGAVWPEEAAAPASSSVEMFHSADDSGDDDIDVDLGGLAPPPRLEPLASLQRAGGATLSAMPRQEIASTTGSSASIRVQPTGELEGLLGHLQGREPLEDSGDGELRLASAALPPLPAAPVLTRSPLDEADDPSLEGLVSAARREFTAQVPAVQEEAPPDAILDNLLGELPPPPARPSGAVPTLPFVQPIQPLATEAGQEKPKKGGFFSRLFKRD